MLHNRESYAMIFLVLNGGALDIIGEIPFYFDREFIIQLLASFWKKLG